MEFTYHKTNGGFFEYQGNIYPVTHIWQNFSEDKMHHYLGRCKQCERSEHPQIFCPMENCWHCGMRGHWNLVCPHFGAKNACHLMRYNAVEDLRRCMRSRCSKFDAKLAALFEERCAKIICDADYDNVTLIAEVLYLGARIRRELFRAQFRPNFVSHVHSVGRRVRNRRAHDRAKLRRQRAKAAHNVSPT